MAQSNVYIDAQDYSGYTVLNYCYTYEIYNELRRQGAPFQLKVWAYFNPITATALATVSGVVCMTVIAHLSH